MRFEERVMVFSKHDYLTDLIFLALQFVSVCSTNSTAQNLSNLSKYYSFKLTYNNPFYNKYCRPLKNTWYPRQEFSCTDNTANKQYATADQLPGGRIFLLFLVHNQHTPRTRPLLLEEDLKVNSDAVRALTLVCDVQKKNVSAHEVGVYAGVVDKYLNRTIGDYCWKECCRNFRWRR